MSEKMTNIDINDIDISVVIPVYNVEEYLIECLDSIRNQTKDKLQVILIDDGSKDSSGELADEYCKEHSNFECHHIENQGLGHARNYALQFVKGKYITYMDSDDILPPDAYEKMFNAAERNNSDITSCNVVRFNTTRFSDSMLHLNAMNPLTEDVTHITRDFSLLYDTIACNKLIRVDFMKKHGFKFPENILYEDIPTTIPMHYLANNVSIVKSTAYYWRVRDGVTTSITQNISNLQNLYDRITVMTMNNKFFKEHNIGGELLKAKLIKDLESDLILFVNNCKVLPDEVVKEVFSCVNKYIDEYVDEDILSSLRLIYRQKYEHVMNNDIAGLRNFLEYQNNYHHSRIKEINGKFLLDCDDELFTVKKRNVTTDVIKTHPKKFINKFKANAQRATISAHVYLPRVNITTADQQKIKAYLFNDFTHKRVELPVEYYVNETLTAKKGVVFDDYSKKTSNYNYDGTGFRVIIEPSQLQLDADSLGTNHILVEYENRVKSGSVLLGNFSKGTREKLIDSAIVDGDNRIVFNRNEYGEILVNVFKLDAVVEEIVFQKSDLRVTVSKELDSIYLKGEDEDIKPSEVEGSTYTFQTSVLKPDYFYQLEYLDNAGNGQSLYSVSNKAVVKRTKKGVVFVSPTKDYHPIVMITPILGLVSAVAKSEEPNVIDVSTALYGSAAKMAKATGVVLGFDDDVTKKFFPLAKADAEPAEGKIKNTLSIDFSNKKLTKNMHECFTRLKMVIISQEGSPVVVPLYAKKAINVKNFYESLKVRFHNYQKNKAVFTVWQAWDEDEEALSKRKALIEKEYKEYRELPINKHRILFESMWGKKYSCNPQAIYEYIDKNYPEYECIWALNDERYPIKGHAKRVRRNSLKYFYYLATSKYLVNNVNFPDTYIKRKGQIEVQTMHGTPLKTFGLEIPGELDNEKERQEFINRNSRWNYLVVQGEFTAKKAFDCFGVNVKKLRTGYPRTDMLFEPSEKKIKKLKQQLGIPLKKKVVLYAPTWRVMNKFDMQLDIENFRQKLGDDYVLLVRIHHFSAAGYDVPADNKFVFNMRYYSSIEDLYMISDMLITDYSSALFDYAITKKPMIFYLYDIKEYSENLRGTYFDIEKEAPGPVAYDNDRLVDVIANVDKEMAHCKERIDSFYGKYVNYECGNSSEKVVKAMLKGRNLPWNKRLRKKAFEKREQAKQKKLKKKQDSAAKD